MNGKWIQASLDAKSGMLILSIEGRKVATHTEVNGSHYLILAERPAETHRDPANARARLLEVLREEGGDVDELQQRENSVFKVPL